MRHRTEYAYIASSRYLAVTPFLSRQGDCLPVNSAHLKVKTLP